MTASTRSSNTFARCRLDWRPSRLLGGALALLTFAAALSILASEMPRVVAWPLVILVLGSGLLQVRREHRRHPHTVVVDPNTARILLDDRELDDARLRWRGPLAFLIWRDARRRRCTLIWWPDTLPASQRRELRLAASGFPPPSRPGTMAP